VDYNKKKIILKQCENKQLEAKMNRRNKIVAAHATSKIIGKANNSTSVMSEKSDETTTPKIKKLTFR
jgi:hypothetical protein